jgi:hypothetical protein
MLPEEDVPMSSTRFGLNRWYQREIAEPLTAMYARIDDHALSPTQDEDDTPPVSIPTGRPASASE